MSTTTDSYDSMTKADLQAEAEERGIAVDPAATKQDLIDGLRADDAGATGELTEAEVPAQVPAEPDVADVDAGSGEGEEGPVILAGYWVRLGSEGDVPEAFVGHLAVVLESPWAPAPIGVEQSGIAGYTFDEDKKYLVRTRDEANATFEVEPEGIAASAQSRVDLAPYG